MDLNTGWYTHDFFCGHTPEEAGLIERLVCLFEAKTYSPSWRGHVRQLRTHTPVEDTCTPGKTSIPGEDT